METIVFGDALGSLEHVSRDSCWVLLLFNVFSPALLSPDEISSLPPTLLESLTLCHSYNALRLYLPACSLLFLLSALFHFRAFLPRRSRYAPWIILIILFKSRLFRGAVTNRNTLIPQISFGISFLQSKFLFLLHYLFCRSINRCTYT